MPAHTRTLSIVYGGTTVGGATDYLIHDKVRIERRYGLTTVSFTVAFGGASSDADFASDVSTLETAFTKPRQRLQILQNGETLLDLDPSVASGANTGFNARPSISKLGDDGDTGRSRVYEVSIEVDTPSDLTGQNGLTDASIEITYLPSRRRNLTISGEYRALGGNTAEDQYLASIGSYASTIITALTGTWELVDENYNYNDTNTIASFSRTYEELAFNQSSSSLNDTNVVQLRLDVARTRVGPGDSVFGAIYRMTRMIVSVDAWIDTSADLKTIWENTLRPYVITRANTLGELASAAVTDENISFDEKDSRISGTISVSGPTQSNLVQARITQSIDESSGLVHTPVWSNERFAAHTFQGPALRVRTTTITKRTVTGGRSGGRAVGSTRLGQTVGARVIYPDVNNATTAGRRDPVEVDLSDDINNSLGQGGWKPVSKTRTETPSRIGIPPDTIDILDEVEVTQERWVTTP